MNINKLFLDRKSVRSFSNKQIDKETIVELLNSTRLAPSAVNYQPWRFFVCSSEEIKQRIVESYPRKWFQTAPLYIVACVDKSQSWKRAADNKDHGNIDVAIAITHLTLKATELGLGTTWACWFDTEAIKSVLDLPSGWEPFLMLPLGYPAEDAKPSSSHSSRKALDETVIRL